MRENRLPQISAQMMALPSQQHLKWTLEFISSIKVEGVTVEGPFCILDGLPASLPPKAFYHLREKKALQDRGFGIRLSCPGFLPDAFRDLHYKDVVFLNEKGVQALKRVLGGLYIRLKAAQRLVPSLS
jgi:hypothetical protein